jgi:hypothetical protein
VNGGIEIEEVRGDVAADVVNGPVTASGLAGQGVFIDFWATWCGPEGSAQAFARPADNRFVQNRMP